MRVKTYPYESPCNAKSGCAFVPGFVSANIGQSAINAKAERSRNILKARKRGEDAESRKSEVCGRALYAQTNGKKVEEPQ